MKSSLVSFRTLAEKQLRIKLRSWTSSICELLFPVVLLLLFNAPNLFTHRPTAPETDVMMYAPSTVLSANGSAAEALVEELIGGFLAPPLYPPMGPFDALHVPFYWQKDAGAPPTIAIAPRSSTGTSREYASLLYAILRDGFLNGTAYAESVRLFDSDASIEASYLAHPNTLWAGIIIEEDTQGFTYTIRLNGSFVPPSTSGSMQKVQPIGVRNGATRGEFAYYHSTGFFTLQQLISLAIDALRDPMAAAAQPPPSMQSPMVRTIRELPSVPQNLVNTPYALVWITGWCMNVANTFFVSSALTAVVFEKEHAIWQGLATLGVPPVAWWSHWGVALLLRTIPIALLDTAVMYLVGICYFSNPLLIFIFVLLYFVALVAVVLALVPLLPKSDKSVTVSTGVAFILSIAYLPLVVFSVDDHIKRFLAFVPWHSFFYGVEIIRFLEDLKVGVTFGTLVAGDWGVSFGCLLLIMLSAPILWMLLAAYLSRVMPAFGAPRSVCFCATEPILFIYRRGTSRWCRHRRRANAANAATSNGFLAPRSDSSQLSTSLLNAGSHSVWRL
jgi:hypothetical protein